METTLHRQLKELYCDDSAGREVQIDGYRIDAVVDGTLIEIQQASLSALRGKLKILLQKHRVTVVKPLFTHKTIIRRAKKGGKIASRRTSPRHETLLDVFQELVHFVEIFPHPRLTLEVLLTEQEEHRIPQRRRWFRARDYRVEDRQLMAVNSRHVLRTTGDLAQLLPADLPMPFTTADLAAAAKIPRWLAQKMAYCLRKMQAIEIAGKKRNSLLYALPADSRAAA